MAADYRVEIEYQDHRPPVVIRLAALNPEAAESARQDVLLQIERAQELAAETIEFRDIDGHPLPEPLVITTDHVATVNLLDA